MPRVLFIAPSAYLLSGLATWLDNLGPGLEDHGWEVVVGLLEGARHHRPLPYTEVHPVGRWIPVRCVTATPVGRRRAVVRAVDKVQPDIIASVNVPDVAEVASSLRSRAKKRLRIVITVHGLEGWLFEGVRRYKEQVDAVISTNRLAARLAETFGHLPAERSLYASYGVAIPKKIIRKRSTNEDLLRIAWVGRLEEPQKRVHDVPRIIESLERRDIAYELIIVGDGPEKSAVQQGFGDRVAAGKVRFTGRLDPSVVSSKIYSQCDVLLLTSSWETGPIVIWEAMARGIPVVTSSYLGSGLENALIHRENALVFEIGDAVSAAAALELLARDDHLRTRIGEAGRDLVRFRYSVESSATAWSAAFERTLKLPDIPNVASIGVPVNGRLDRWIGTEYAETVREVLRRRFIAAEPGGEWPHTYSKISDEAAFREVARGHDQRPTRGPS